MVKCKTLTEHRLIGIVLAKLLCCGEKIEKDLAEQGTKGRIFHKESLLPSYDSLIDACQLPGITFYLLSACAHSMIGGLEGQQEPVGDLQRTLQGKNGDAFYFSQIPFNELMEAVQSVINNSKVDSNTTSQSTAEVMLSESFEEIAPAVDKTPLNVSKRDYLVQEVTAYLKNRENGLPGDQEFPYLVRFWGTLIRGMKHKEASVRLRTLMFIGKYNITNKRVIQKMRELATKTDSREILLRASAALLMADEEVDRKRVREEIEKAQAESGADMTLAAICLRLLSKDDKMEIGPKRKVLPYRQMEASLYYLRLLARDDNTEIEGPKDG